MAGETMKRKNMKWNLISCHPVDASLSSKEEYAIAEFEVSPHFYLTATDLNKMFDEMMSQLNDDGEVELEWAIAPALTRENLHSSPIAIIEMAIVETTKTGRRRP